MNKLKKVKEALEDIRDSHDGYWFDGDDTIRIEDIAEQALAELKEFMEGESYSATKVDFTPYPGWQFIIDKEGVVHHMPTIKWMNELLGAFSSLYYKADKLCQRADDKREFPRCITDLTQDLDAYKNLSITA